MYDLLVGQVKLAVIFSCPLSMGSTVLRLTLLNYYSFYTKYYVRNFCNLIGLYNSGISA